MNKYSAILIISFALTLWFSTVSVAQESNLIKDIISTQDSLNNKSSLVFVLLPWCTSSCQDGHEILPIITKYRNNYNVLLVIDSSYYSDINSNYHLLVDSFTSNKLFSVNSYFKNGLKKKKECERLGKDFAQLYNEKDDSMIGPGAIWLSNCDGKIINIYTIYNRGLAAFESDVKGLSICK